VAVAVKEVPLHLEGNLVQVVLQEVEVVLVQL
jgi:hypothetical protein